MSSLELPKPLGLDALHPPQRSPWRHWLGQATWPFTLLMVLATLLSVPVSYTHLTLPTNREV